MDRRPDVKSCNGLPLLPRGGIPRSSALGSQRVTLKRLASTPRSIMPPSRCLVTVVWYHDTMTKSITVRLPDELAADAEALARVDGTSLNETVKKSLLKEVERRRKSPEFKARLTRIIEEDRELLERLAR